MPALYSVDKMARAFNFKQNVRKLLSVFTFTQITICGFLHAERSVEIGKHFSSNVWKNIFRAIELHNSLKITSYSNNYGGDCILFGGVHIS